MDNNFKNALKIDTLSKRDKETIENLIVFFNKSKM